jgi:hypothetical protein
MSAATQVSDREQTTVRGSGQDVSSVMIARIAQNDLEHRAYFDRARLVTSASANTAKI